MTDQILDSFLTIRVSEEFRNKLHKKAKRFGKPSDVVRQILEAFVEDRLQITQSDSKENLYVNRNTVK